MQSSASSACSVARGDERQVGALLLLAKQVADVLRRDRRGAARVRRHVRAQAQPMAVLDEHATQLAVLRVAAGQLVLVRAAGSSGRRWIAIRVEAPHGRAPRSGVSWPRNMPATRSKKVSSSMPRLVDSRPIDGPLQPIRQRRPRLRPGPCRRATTTSAVDLDQPRMVGPAQLAHDDLHEQPDVVGRRCAARAPIAERRLRQPAQARAPLRCRAPLLECRSTCSCSSSSESASKRRGLAGCLGLAEGLRRDEAAQMAQAVEPYEHLAQQPLPAGGSPRAWRTLTATWVTAFSTSVSANGWSSWA